MPTNKTPIHIDLDEEERQELERMARGQTLEHRLVVRAQTILWLADGQSVSAVGRRVGRQRRIVRKWADRFIRKRLGGLADGPRSGRPPRFSPRGGALPGQARVRAA